MKPGCSWWLWWLRLNLVPSDGEQHTFCCILTSITLYLECGDIYLPSEQHVCYTFHRHSSYAVAIYIMPGNVYAFLLPRATFYLSTIAICWMLHTSHICSVWRCGHLLQYRFLFRYITCRCICFAIIVIFRSEIYCPIITLSSTIHSVLHILCWFIIGLWYFLHIICIHIVPIVTLIPVKITGSQVKPFGFSHWPLLPTGGADGIGLVTLFTFIFVIPAAPWHPEMQFVIHAIVVYRNGWVSPSDLRFLKHHFGGQIVNKNSIVNTSCLHANDHGRHWVLCLLDLMPDCSKGVYINAVPVALRDWVPGVHQECLQVCNTRRG